MNRRIIAIFAVLLVIALGLTYYAYELKRKVAHDEQLASQQQQAMTPPANGPATLVALYLASDSDGSLRKTQLNLQLPPERSERARAVLRALLAQYLQPGSSHAIGQGSDIRDVYLLGDDTAIVDTDAAFADAHPSGVLAEELTVGSMVVTLNANDPAIQRVKILVNGQERETLAGHADLHRFYEVSNIGQVMKDMQ